MRFLLIFFISFTLYGSTILNVNIKKLNDQIEIFFNFDTPYEGRLVQRVEKEKIRVILKDAKILTSWSKKIDTPFVYQIEVIPKGKNSELIIYTIEKAAILAAKSSDGYGLKLLIKRLSSTNKNSNEKKSIKQDEKKEYTLFLLILGGIIIVAAFLIIFIFFTPKSKKIKKKTINVQNPKESELEIKFEKKLDEHNKIALISFKGINYLVIIGSTNILLGKYSQNITDQEEFEKLIKESGAQIKEAFTPKDDQELFNELEIYKEKASK